MTAREFAAPKYYRVKEELRRLAREAGPEASLPTERTLAARYQTSRTTVRQAISELVAEGLLNRTQGKGTFVAPSRPTYVRQLTSFTQDAEAQHLKSTSDILGIDTVPADAYLAEQLRVPLGGELTRLERVRVINGEPLAHETAYLPGDLLDLKQHLARNGSLYAILRNHYGTTIAEVEDTVMTVVAGPLEAHLLGIETGAPLLLTQRRGLDANGIPVEWTRSAFRGDRFQFFARTSGVDTTN
ncbi:GntR family transcriptional regulator [Nesterenkonia sp. AY15]|uniref:GntR family transcriptional regulator n=1 Tax=Nesterenkonia sp. AY15 TaxID=2901139 RepID=UPI001F4CFB9A|nr:GntR family transcriptional regulator [Nesterenkonia sp. AY15]MCH8571623.1 GntR family transcriptional regulator [Nesterenkonia sp. AY15]